MTNRKRGKRQKLVNTVACCGHLDMDFVEKDAFDLFCWFFSLSVCVFVCFFFTFYSLTKIAFD